MTLKSAPDPHATEVLQPVAPATEKFTAVPRATEKLNAVPQATEKLAPVPQVTEQMRPVPTAGPAVGPAAIPAQRMDSRPAPAPAPAADFTPTAAPASSAPHRARWEHLPTERHPAEQQPQGRHPAESAPAAPAAPQPVVQRTESDTERSPQRRLRAAQLLVARTTELRAVPRKTADGQKASGRPADQRQWAPEQSPAPERQSPPKPPAPPKPRWQRSAVTVAPTQGTLAAAGFAACDYLIRTVSILGLLAVVGMVTAGTAETQERAPSTTVATAPAHQNGFTSTHHQR